MTAARHFQRILLVLLAILSLVSSHESCCKHKLAASQEAEFIVDPTDTTPPIEFEGVRRLIPDPNAVKPDDWDDEDDGPWEPGLIDNPDYNWQPRRMKNSNSVPQGSFWKKLQGEVNEAMPWVTLGVLLVAALSVIPLPLDTLRRELTGGGPLSLLKAGLIGLATPLCSCGSLPIAASLVANGVPLSSAVAFLTASQSAGLDSAFITYGLLGPTAAVCRLVGALLLAIAAGAAVPSKPKQKSRKKASTVTEAAKTPFKPSDSNIMMRPLFVLVETATDIIPLVLLGLAASTLMVHYIPQLTRPFDAIQKGVRPVSIRLGILFSSLPLQLCEHTTAALAAGIRKAGGSPGLSFAFLLSAPATNVPSLLLLMQHNTKAAARVSMALVLTACVLSYAMDGAGMDMLVEKEVGGAMASLPGWFVVTSPWLAGSLVISGFISRGVAATRPKGDCACPVSCGPDGSKKHD